MKKLLACLLIVAILCSLSIMLFSCDADELKKLEYTNENGEVVTTSIKKTDDPDKVTAAICALANKPVDTTDLSTALLSASVGLNVAGTQEEQAFACNLALNAKVGAGVPTTIKEDATLAEIVNAMKLYAELGLTGTVPKDIFKAIDDKEIPNFADTVTLNESLKAYLDETTLYVKGDVSEDLYTMIPKLAMIQSLCNGKLQKMDLSIILLALTKYKATLIDSINMLHDPNNSVIKVVDGVEDIVETFDDDDEDAKDETPAVQFTYADVKVFVEAFNIQIVKTKGSVATFTATINADSIAKINEAFKDRVGYEPLDFGDFKGTINIEAAIDAKTMMDMSVNITASNLLTLSEEEQTASKVTITSSSLTFNFSISTNCGIPTLSQEEKDSAEVMQSLED